MLAANLLLATAFATASGDAPRTGVTSSGTQTISPAVVATWISREQVPYDASLDLLVLWRGTPGWFMRSGGSEVRGVGSLDDEGGAESRETMVEQVLFGGLELELKFERQTRTAYIQGREVPLHNANVILVDQVTAPMAWKSLRPKQ